ncbi:hypothetical protein M878_15455 [Streptomyces roseochromogenus subsp. oscitans DS 12.976]|uniref:Uncharacterized protein n=1 Tax=Streptomyces roseochromogenus subsp. oscitans DS 12.976 TaxID=1352936 RepID=V6KJ07_STRRC|nr:hypothetical protein M878_15455 [Streptomyces roseochromogenus subsp. oscitans DS 12.976]
MPVPLDWSYAAVNSVADTPATSPSYRFRIVATPTGTAVSTTGSGSRTSAGGNSSTLNVPEALMPRC